jgi:hypothetical protein
MRRFLALAILPGCATAGAMLYSSAAMADPYMYRDIHDEWTNLRYDDGVCRYRYTHNAENGNTNVERWGDCSHVVIGPNGEPARVAVVPAYPVPRVYRSR